MGMIRVHQPGTIYLIPLNVWHAVEAVNSVAYGEVHSNMTAVDLLCNHANVSNTSLPTVIRLTTSPVSRCRQLIQEQKQSRSSVTLSGDHRHWALAKRKLESTPLRGWSEHRNDLAHHSNSSS